MKLEHTIALASRKARPEELELRAEILAEREVSLALLFFRFFSFFLSTAVSWLQAWIAVPTSSSYFLHLLKAAVHFAVALTNFLASAEMSQPFTVVAKLTRVELAQQVQAEAPVSLRQAAVMLLNSAIATEHMATSVVFGWGRFEALQADPMLASH